MTPSAKLFVFVGTLLGGLIVALPFRAKTTVKERTAPPAQPAATNPGTPVSLTIGGGSMAGVETRRTEEASPRAEPVDLSSQVSANAFGDNRLPEIESDYQSLLRPLPGREGEARPASVTLPRVERTEREVPNELQSYEVAQLPIHSVEEDWSRQTPAEPARLGPQITQDSLPVHGRPEARRESNQRTRSPNWVSRHAPVRSEGTYRLRDGDTLRDLAARFLGDANRADEIYQLNRAIIRHPEVLPLGLEIKIPSR